MVTVQSRTVTVLALNDPLSDMIRLSLPGRLGAADDDSASALVIRSFGAEV
jgi:hypothetical protein